MKVLWIASKPLPFINEANNITGKQMTTGWVDGLYSSLMKISEDILFGFCYPVSENKKVEGQAGNVTYFGIPRICDFQKVQDEAEKRFKEIVEKFQPDVITIFGTEHTYQCAMANFCQKFGLSQRTSIWIQGLVSNYYLHYQAALPEYVIKGYTLKELIKRRNLEYERKAFLIRGKDEKKAICSVGHIIGRTDWDRACAWTMGTKARYHFCNEILRKSFYIRQWDAAKCERHTIFVSQSTYPIKGFHLMLEALAILKKHYPNVHLYTTGRSLLDCSTGQKLRWSSYEKYLYKRIACLKLQENVTWLGTLSEEEMCDRYLRSNVFVSPSSAENSPNSLGEAMILGVPCVASDVGGVRNLLEDKKEGFVYAYDDPAVLAYYVHCIFSGDCLAANFSAAARQRAQDTHCPDKNAKMLLDIYTEILKSNM